MNAKSAICADAADIAGSRAPQGSPNACYRCNGGTQKTPVNEFKKRKNIEQATGRLNTEQSNVGRQTMYQIKGKILKLR